jgi:pyrroline-5-carboxylate reductase
MAPRVIGKMDEVSVIGCGNMGRSLITGLARDGGFHVTGYDIDPEALAAVEGMCHPTDDLTVAATAPTVVLAVKPTIVPIVLGELELGATQTLMTIAAGVERAYVQAHTPATVVRVMPNLAAEYGEMAAAVSWDAPDAGVQAILEAVGSYVEIDEALMDVATALNGSGPAFVYYLIEAMAARASAAGMDPTDARVLATQTFKGAASTVAAADAPIESLIDAVCSPQGTTIEGMAVLRESTVAAELGDALDAAARRSAELAAEVDDV